MWVKIKRYGSLFIDNFHNKETVRQDKSIESIIGRIKEIKILSKEVNNLNDTLVGICDVITAKKDNKISYNDAVIEIDRLILLHKNEIKMGEIYYE